MFDLPKNIVVFDIECTTWKGAMERNWSGEGEHREVVEVGAILTETDNFSELDSFKSLVKPKINPSLSNYFIALTGITQKRVNEKGIDFPTFLQRFSNWCGEFELYCFDSGEDRSRLFDRDVLMENCNLLGIKFPFRMDRFHDIDDIFQYYSIKVKQSGKAPEAFGIKISARPHDALNDARGLIIALRALREEC